ncbi:DUF5455 family protein [Halomonas sp. KO116]|uniref:DUF5455 family protein n=1 Tax=Halomonas sp. KO116 TaxID=1504981 RepID=UPI0004E40F65|nr:DUF5455 family protein [Halomonas sp. KO116]AJY52134.1 hypothetical protein KO116_03667 [Halomonas sp. KO116]
MASPLAGIAAIWATLVEVISQGVFKAHVQIFGIKVGLRVALFTIKIGAIVIVINLLYSSVSTLFDTIVVTLPPMLGDGIERILPGNFIACLSAIIGVKAVAFLFAIYTKLISLFLSDF